MKNFHLLFLLFPLMSIGQASSNANANMTLSTNGSMSLNQAIEFALQNNYDHKNQLLDNAIMFERVKEIITTGLPNINAGATYKNNFYLPTSILPGEIVGKPGTQVPVKFGTSNNMDVNIEWQQLIFDGRYLVGLQARKMMKQVSESQVKMSEQNVKDLIKKSYFAVLMTRESKNTISQNKMILEKLLSDTRKIYKEGLIEELDVDRLQLSLANLEKEISKLDNQYALALTALKFNIGYDLDKGLSLTDSIDTYFEEYNNLAPNNNFDIKNRAEYKLLNDNITLKGYDVKQQKAGYMPSLVGFLNTGTQAQRTAFNFTNSDPWFYYGMFGIKLNVPIYDGGNKKTRINQTQIGVEKAKNDLEKFKLAAKLQAYQAQINFYNAKKDYSNYLETLALAKKINAKAKIMFKEGIGSSFELANSESELVKTQLNVLQSMYSIIISKLDYDKAVGN